MNLKIIFISLIISMFIGFYFNYILMLLVPLNFLLIYSTKKIMVLKSNTKLFYIALLGEFIIYCILSIMLISFVY